MGPGGRPWEEAPDPNSSGLADPAIASSPTSDHGTGERAGRIRIRVYGPIAVRAMSSTIQTPHTLDRNATPIPTAHQRFSGFEEMS